VRADFQNDHACSFLWREAQHLAKISIESDQRSTLDGTGFEQFLIGCASEFLTAGGLNIVARGREELQSAPSDIFVELELHAAPPIGTGTTRSREASAP